MPNAFKQKREEDKQKSLLADCVAMAARGGAVNMTRAIAKYMKETGVSKCQAEETLTKARKS